MALRCGSPVKPSALTIHPEQNWEANGIIPDETVPGEFDENTLENDPPVIAAIDLLLHLCHNQLNV